MSNYTVTVLPGPKLPTFQLIIKDDDVGIGELILIPHSSELYELHLSTVHKIAKGKTIELAKATFKFIFNELKKIQKLMVMVPVHNRLAIRLAKNVMTHEGTLTKSSLYNDAMEDQVIYGISRGEVECL